MFIVHHPSNFGLLDIQRWANRHNFLLIRVRHVNASPDDENPHYVSYQVVRD